ncbi:permease [Sphingomonas sp. Leaf407]|uniref:DMT family transporter n=1 Tax=Sphingomonas sp. Leaf4 TaxID=2876553 RepID=UPI0006F92730|nr:MULTISPECIES: DMT family transporter [unclassified Sphingomonas]KQN35629.1 permease [Sphingomonas sp. Leaf42]KQT26496.1 permease [Sphingomonas sp. Leaf407]
MQPVSPETKASLPPSVPRRAVLAVIVANVALAFGPWFVRLADTGPVAAAFWRILLALPVLLVAAAWANPRAMTRAGSLWLPILIAGLAFAVDLGSWHIGIRRTTLANATLFGNCAVLIFPLYGFLAMRQWPTRVQGAALLLAAVGGGLLIGRSAELSSRHLAGDLFCLLAGVLYAVYFIVMAGVRRSVAPLPALALSSIAGVLPLLGFALLLGEPIWPGTWSPLLLLALVSQIAGQGLMIYALGALTPLVVGLALLVQPLVAATIGWLAYGERLTATDAIGAALVATALAIVGTQRRKAG